MKRTEKNNKGFSLVELIVVVLILGILSISIAPQIMKWLDKSKISSDKANANELKYGVQVALTAWQEQGGMVDDTVDFGLDVKKNGTVTCTHDWSGGTATETLKTVIDKNMGSTYPKVQYEVLSGTTDVGFRVTVKKGTGMITVKCEAQTVTE